MVCAIHHPLHTTIVTPSPAACVTPSPAACVTPSPAACVTPSPAACVTPSPAACVTPSPAAHVTPSLAAHVTPSPPLRVLQYVHAWTHQWRGELYWPAVEYGASTMNHGPFSITVKSADKKPFCTFSQLEITKTDVRSASNTHKAHVLFHCVVLCSSLNLQSPSGIRAVTHMHFTKWPDYGVPESPHDFLAFREQVRKTGLLESSEGPCVIHCV